MAYKSILTVLNDSDIGTGVLQQASFFAAEFDAHLDVLALGVDRTQSGYFNVNTNAMIVQDSIERALEDANALADLAKSNLKTSSLKWDVEKSVAHLQDVSRQVAMRARFSDLVVLPRPYGKGRAIEQDAITEAALFEGQAPVLVVPDDPLPAQKFEKIIVGWNEGSEALVAMRRALPLLKAAETVRVVIIDPPAHGPTRSDPGGMVARFLARHGVRVEIDILARSLPRVSDVLMRHAQDHASDLVVMGAYGHSRFREAILGGATRNMLEQAEIPVFLAH